MTENQNPEAQLPNQQKVEKASRELFTCLLQNELSEAESVSSIAMVLAMRLAYASKSLKELETKLEKFPEIFRAYVRANLSNVESTILAKQAELERMN